MFRVLTILLLVLGMATSCERGKVIKQSAAYEVPLYGGEDRAEFLDILQEQAAEFGFHVDYVTDEELASYSDMVRRTFSAAVWNGANDEELIATASDQPGNLGRIWILISVGNDPEASARFKTSLMEEVRASWPETKELPLLNGETIPLPDDLIIDGDRYILDPSAAHRYNLPNAPSASPAPSS